MSNNREINEEKRVIESLIYWKKNISDYLYQVNNFEGNKKELMELYGLYINKNYAGYDKEKFKKYIHEDYEEGYFKKEDIDNICDRSSALGHILKKNNECLEKYIDFEKCIKKSLEEG